MKGRLLHTHAAMAFAAVALGVAIAQDNAAGPVPKRERVRDKELPQISVIDRLLSVEAALAASLNRSGEEQWAQSYQELCQKFMRDGALSAIPGQGDDEVVSALVLGIKAADAVLALKARNVEAMSLASDQIDALARKLGATEAELGMANTVKKYARERRWLDAFMALGFLQRNILSCLRLHPERQDQAKLVIVGGWLQSGRCVTHMIKENYNDLASNILREPRLVAMIQEALEEVAPSCRNDERMKEITGRLPEIKKRVTVGFQEAVKKEDVEWLHKTFDDLVIEVTTGKAASKDQEPVAASSATAGTPGHGPAQNRGGAAQVAGSSDIGRQSSSQISHADSPQSAAGGHPEASGPLPDIEFQENGAPAALDGRIHWPRSPLPWLGGLLLALGILLGRILARRHKS